MFKQANYIAEVVNFKTNSYNIIVGIPFNISRELFVYCRFGCNLNLA